MSAAPESMSPSAALAAFVARSSWEAIDPAVREQAQRSVADALGAAAQGAASPAADAAFLVVGELGSVAEAGVIGRGVRVAAPAAALINAASARAGGGNADEAVVVFAALAAGEAAGTEGEGFLHAVALGLEVAQRVTDALGASHRTRGYDTAGTSARVGAAAAAGIILGLNGDEMRSAFGYAATAAGGLAAAVPPEVAALIAGLAAADAVRAARLAHAGLIGPPEPLEGRRGLLALESRDGDASRLVDGLGARWASASGSPAPAPLVAALAGLATRDGVGHLVEDAGRLSGPER